MTLVSSAGVVDERDGREPDPNPVLHHSMNRSPDEIERCQLGLIWRREHHVGILALRPRVIP